MAWYGNSRKHSLCARGIETGRKYYNRRRPKPWDEMSDVEKDLYMTKKKRKEDFGKTRFYDRHKEDASIAYLKRERHKIEVPFYDLEEIIKAQAENRPPEPAHILKAGDRIVRLDRVPILDTSKFPFSEEEQKKIDEEWYKDIAIRNEIRQYQNRKPTFPEPEKHKYGNATLRRRNPTDRIRMEMVGLSLGIGVDKLSKMTGRQLSKEIRKREWIKKERNK
jgi:hypothetical protein